MYAYSEMAIFGECMFFFFRILFPCFNSLPLNHCKKLDVSDFVYRIYSATTLCVWFTWGGEKNLKESRQHELE
jgi:hypothetical protein